VFVTRIQELDALHLWDSTIKSAKKASNDTARKLDKGQILMQEKIDIVVNYLNDVKTRCTYNAAAKALGITPQALKKQLGEPRHEVSWLVNVGTEEPAGYSDEDKHPELYRTKRIIKSAEVLTRNLDI